MTSNAYRASSNFDQRHNVTIAYVYDLPFFKAKGLAHSLLGGWQWSGITLIQSGSPFSVYNAGNGSIAPSDNAGVGTGASQIGNFGSLTGGSYPDLVGDPRTGVQSTPFAGFGPLLFNPAAFVAPERPDLRRRREKYLEQSLADELRHGPAQTLRGHREQVL